MRQRPAAVSHLPPLDLSRRGGAGARAAAAGPEGGAALHQLRRLDVEELGSVYESLLELQPAVDLEGERRLHLVASGERKETGSYYTPSSLVHELIESALALVMAEWLAAARRMGRELAKVRTREAEPAPADFRQAVRDVIRTCIYAVDKNPLAVDLCKVALWIEGHATGLSLGFLDHHVKCGDSLVGVFDLDVLWKGIPDGAYKPVTGDDAAVAKAVMKLNKGRRETGQRALEVSDGGDVGDPLRAQAGELRSLAEMPEETAGDVRAKEALYRGLREEGTTWWRYRVACDLWTAAFFAPLVAADGGGMRLSLVPTSDDVFLALDRLGALHGQVVDQAQGIRQRAGFFHWPLEFPEVFAAVGFDVVLGNPPWDLVKIEDKKFFAVRAPEIAAAGTASIRKRMIAALETSVNPADRALYQEYLTALRDAEAAAQFLRDSGRYPLSGRGSINLYAVFAETMMSAVRTDGAIGAIMPAGIVTDYGTRHFFQKIIGDHRLKRLMGFENEGKIFPSIDNKTKFCLLTLGGRDRRSPAADFVFFARQADDLHEEWRHYRMSREDLRLLRPNTLNSPSFRSGVDAELVKRIYRRVPVLIDESRGLDP